MAESQNQRRDLLLHKAILDENRVNCSIIKLLIIQECARVENKAHTLLFDLTQIIQLTTNEWH